jgi:rhodanese-related sulfurtransferase
MVTVEMGGDAGKGDKGMGVTKGVGQLVEEAKSKIHNLPVSEAIEHRNDVNAVFVDIRDVRELQRDGMIPGAFHAPRGMLEFWVDPASPYHKEIFADPDKEFILYCASGWRSALATKALQDMGMDNVSHVEGGFSAWREAGGPVADMPVRKR